MANFSDIRSDYEEFWRFANNTWSVYNKEAQYDLRIFNGDSWSYKEREYLRQQGRNALEFNVIRPHINFFSGYFRDTMTSVSVMPVESSDQKTADQLGETMIFTYDKGDADHIIAESVTHAFKVGISLMGFFLDYSKDPVNGDLAFFWKPYNSFILDPYFKKRDLSDCGQAILREYVTRDSAKILLPFISAKDIDTIPANTKDDKFLSLPERNKFFDNTDLLTYDQYYRRTSREVELLVDMESGQTRELPKDRDIRNRVVQSIATNSSVEIMKRFKPTVELNIVLGGEVVYSGPDPTAIDDFPFVANICYYDPDISDYGIKLQGLTRGQRDIQREINKRNSKYIDIIDKNIYSGFFYKPSKLVDEESIWQTGQGPNIPLKDSAEVGRDISPIPPPSIPPGMLEYSQALNEMAPRLMGINEDMLGQSEGGNNLVSGALAQIRASNGLRSNRALFDNMEYSQKKLAEKVLEAIQKNYGPAKVKRIINEEPTEEFYDQTFDQYDAQIVQTVKSQNQRQQFYVDLLQARQLGVEIPDDLIIEAMPMQNKGELLERMEQLQQQKAEQQAKIDEQEKIAMELANSQTVSNLSLSAERKARMVADIGLAEERSSEAAENRSTAALNRAKTITEISEMESDKVLRVLEFVNMLENQERALQQESAQRIEGTASAINENISLEADALSQKSQQQQQPQGGLNV